MDIEEIIASNKCVKYIMDKYTLYRKYVINVLQIKFGVRDCTFKTPFVYPIQARVNQLSFYTKGYY